MNHYDTLGVAPDATPEEIKAAYRKKAREAHSDVNGGTDEAMAALNVANDVLSDPERRAQYDATGSDQAGPTMEDKAREVLLATLQVAIEAPDDMDAIAAVRGRLDESVQKGVREIDEAKRIVRKLERRRARTIYKGDGVNLVHGLIDSKLHQLRNRVDALHDSIAVLRCAIDMLRDYETLPGEERRQSMFTQQMLGTFIVPPAFLGGIGS